MKDVQQADANEIARAEKFQIRLTELCVKKAGGEWQNLAALLNVVPSLLSAYRKGRRRPTQSRAIAFALLDAELNKQPLEEAIREWIQLVGRPLPSEAMIRALGASGQPSLPPKFLDLANQILKPIADLRLNDDKFWDMTLCRISQERSSSRLRSWLDNNSFGSVMFVWGFDEEQLRSRFTNLDFQAQIRAFIHPAKETYQNRVVDRPPEVNVIGCIQIGKTESERKIEGLQQMVVDFAKKILIDEADTNKFSVYYSKEESDFTDRWIFRGSSDDELRGTMNQDLNNLVSLLKNSKRDDLLSRRFEWTTLVTELPIAVIKHYLSLNELGDCSSASRPGKPWEQIFPQKEVAN